MIEKDSFTRPLYMYVTAATIGIDRGDWYSHRPHMTREEVRETMIRERYDLVPIINKHGVLKHYFNLNRDDVSKLEQNKIETAERLYYLSKGEVYIKLNGGFNKKTNWLNF